jgi:hypothetical protein
MKTEEQPTTNYKGVTITYAEYENRWEFVLRDKERHASTLALAKAAIDKPVPADKKAFKRFDVFYQDGWSSAPIRVTVTSLAADTRYGHNEVWITKPDGERRKIRANELFELSGDNSQVIKRMNENLDEQKKLDRAYENLKSMLKRHNLNQADFD